VKREGERERGRERQACFPASVRASTASRHAAHPCTADAWELGWGLGCEVGLWERRKASSPPVILALSPQSFLFFFLSFFFFFDSPDNAPAD
jgi:hypothetical protein